MDDSFNHLNAPLILVIDDDRFMRIQMRHMLEQEGYQVAEAKNGEEGLTAYAQLQPDIILLDAVMPAMDGFTFCARLQEHFDATSPLEQLSVSPKTVRDQTPILMITSLEDRESVDRAFAVGAADYVTKPIHWAVLRQRVRRLIQQYHLYRQLQHANQQLEDVNQALQRLATTDSLTQLANRRHFDDCLSQEWRRLTREQSALALILADIDHFKHYNDAYGHQAGDTCLQQVAGAIATAVRRPADLVARYGGEEFAIILPNTTWTGAVHVAEEMRSKIKHLELPHAQSSLSQWVTLSLGVASVIPKRDSSPAVLITAADKALYRAKEMGRDCVCPFIS